MAGKFIHKYTLQKHITKLKRTKRFAYMKELNAQAIHEITERIDRAYKLFWRNLKHGIKSAPPKFKKVKRYKSFTLKCNNGFKLDEENSRVYLCGRWYRYFNSRKVEGKIKILTVKRDALGDIYIYAVCDSSLKTVRPRTGKSVGFDFGLKRFLTASDGNDIYSPQFFGISAERIRIKCRALSRTKKDSGNHERARRDLARAYRKITNQRGDFHFKTARRLCKEYALICLEDLNIKGMARVWGKKVHDLAFYSFVQILRYKASEFGTNIIFVGRYYPSSQLCSVCGNQNKAVRNLKVREWDCPVCGTHHDRDRNAAVNILRAGASAYAGGFVRPVSAGSGC